MSIGTQSHSNSFLNILKTSRATDSLALMNYLSQHSYLVEGRYLTRLGGPTFKSDTVTRICPGCWLAYDRIWIAIVSVLSVYNISAAVDGNGFPIQPSIKYMSSNDKVGLPGYKSIELMSD
jgi:hypothetical protein